MNSRDYATYIANDDWKRRREPLIRAHRSKCCLCGIPRGLTQAFDGQDLNVHHLESGYQRIALGEEERPEDVEVRCHLCHQGEHGFGDARIYRSEADWAVIWWIVSRFKQEARAFRLGVAEELAESYIAATKGFRPSSDEIDIVFARTSRRSRGTFPSVADVSAEICALRRESAERRAA